MENQCLKNAILQKRGFLKWAFHSGNAFRVQFFKFASGLYNWIASFDELPIDRHYTHTGAKIRTFKCHLFLARDATRDPKYRFNDIHKRCLNLQWIWNQRTYLFSSCCTTIIRKLWRPRRLFFQAMKVSNSKLAIIRYSNIRPVRLFQYCMLG